MEIKFLKIIFIYSILTLLRFYTLDGLEKDFTVYTAHGYGQNQRITEGPTDCPKLKFFSCKIQILGVSLVIRGHNSSRHGWT